VWLSTSNSETELSPRESILDMITSVYPPVEKDSSKDAEITIRRRPKVTRLALESLPRESQLAPEMLTLLREKSSSNTLLLSENSGKKNEDYEDRRRRVQVQSVAFNKIYKFILYGL